MKITVYPGSFDPVTKGHLDIIERSAKLFDKVIVVVLANPDKQPSFTVEERLEFLRRVVKHLDNIEVDYYSGLLANYVRERGADSIIKGLRAMSDFEYEFQMALTNRLLNPELETLFMNTSGEYMYLSSSMVKQVASFGGDIAQFIPAEIREDIVERLAKGGR